MYIYNYSTAKVNGVGLRHRNDNNKSLIIFLLNQGR